MKTPRRLIAASAIFALSTGCVSGLRLQMKQMQSQSDQLGVAVTEQNATAAGRHVRAIGDTITQIKTQYPRYHDIDLANTMEVILQPATRPVEMEVANANWPAARKNYLVMIESCNRCHSATGNEKIVVKPAGVTVP